MDVILFILCAFFGYAAGSVNSSIIVGKFYGIDIREKGSKNAGLTNTHRVLGVKATLVVLLGDILKGVISVLFGLLMGEISSGSINVEIYAACAGAFSVIGHNWPVYFNFKGGKGILTSAAVVFMLDWKIGLIALGAFIIITAIFKYVSLGSIIGALLAPILAIVFSHLIAFILIMLFLAILAIYRHRTNISRLIHGKENKLSFKKNEGK